MLSVVTWQLLFCTQGQDDAVHRVSWFDISVTTTYVCHTSYTNTILNVCSRRTQPFTHSSEIFMILNTQSTYCGAVCEVVLPGPEAAARAAAAASNKKRSEAEAAIAQAVSNALHILGSLKQIVSLVSGQSHLHLYSLKAQRKACILHFNLPPQGGQASAPKIQSRLHCWYTSHHLHSSMVLYVRHVQCPITALTERL